jgi:hypothetical protein
MNAWKHGIRIGTALAACLIGIAGADYSPMLPGSEWVYQGIGDMMPMGGPLPVANPVQVRFKETLSLKWTGTARKGDTLIHTLLERDSLYGREAHQMDAFSDRVIGPLPDSIATRILTYKEYGGRFRLQNGDNMQSGHSDTADLFFYAHSNVAFVRGSLNGLDPRYRGLQSDFFLTGPTWGQGKAWYLDGVGLYWAKLGDHCSSCGCLGARELLLTSYRGNAVDPGIDPPGAVLMKEGRFACGLRRTASTGFLRLAAEWGSGAVNALGRVSPETAAR